MIVALSRFRVANDKYTAVAKAFTHRPRLVDAASGLLGLEAFTTIPDPALFYLITRWTDASSCRAWHSTEAHLRSNREMPQDIELDPAQTQLVVMNRIETQACVDTVESLDALVADAAPFVATFLGQADAVVLLAAAASGVIRAVNPAAARYLGASAEALVGTTLWDRLPAADATELRRRVGLSPRHPGDRFVLNLLDADEVPRSLECQVDLRPDGFVLLGERIVRKTDMLQDALSSINNELAVMTRESARRGRQLELALAELRAAQATLVHREKMASLGQMTAGIAHEINNPIAFVLNNEVTLARDFEELLALARALEELLPELANTSSAAHARLVEVAAPCELEHLAEAVPRKFAANLEGLDRVTKLVLDLRTFSRLDEAAYKPIALDESIAATLRILGPLARERDVTLESRFEPMPPLVCHAGALNQAISNIVINAIQASAPAQPVVISAHMDGGSHVVLVEDRGSGITPEHLGKVFDPFFTTKPAGAGTGLGLTITHQVIASHGGEIQIQSTPGRGTQVRVWIPSFPASSPTSSPAVGGARS
ncbi:Signal transduction histidine kinase [Enhygromyxa salina]|uniref:histidine kinase n=1 Tax=Enhygromyxa salina TaxID=215803 RepID=A0A0C2DDG0_9BACT|nr:ATP-binding protein [Enhygromyxa salina]KIG19475.1 Signal transduction histidine kinase [Enhygromyxa salina]